MPYASLLQCLRLNEDLRTNTGPDMRSTKSLKLATPLYEPEFDILLRLVSQSDGIGRKGRNRALPSNWVITTSVFT